MNSIDKCVERTFPILNSVGQFDVKNLGPEQSAFFDSLSFKRTKKRNVPTKETYEHGKQK